MFLLSCGLEMADDNELYRYGTALLLSIEFYVGTLLLGCMLSRLLVHIHEKGIIIS